MPRELAATAQPLAGAGAPGCPNPGASGQRPAARDGGPEDPNQLPRAALVAHVVERHHGYARRALPYVVALLGKVTAFHRGRNAKLSALCDAGEELADALDDSLDYEEREIFPALLAKGSPGEAVRPELARMHGSHRKLKLLLARIRWLADDFGAPAWADRSYRVLMEELEALEADLLEHIRVELVLLGPPLATLRAGVC